MKRPSFLNSRKKNGYELNTSTSSSSSSDTPNKYSNNKKEKEVVISSISVLCNESKSHTKKHNTNRSSNNSDVVSPHTVPSSSSSHHVDGGISSNNCGVGLSTKLADTNADELVLNSTTILNNISLEDSYSTSEEGGKVLPSSVAVFVDDLILCGNSCNNKQSEKKSTSVHESTVIAKEEVEGGGQVSPTNVAEFNVSFGSADFDYFVDNRFSTDDDDDEQEHEEEEETGEKKTSESSSNKETNESINNKKADNVRYTMVDNNKTSKGGKLARKKEGNNISSSGTAEFSNTYNDDTFSISLASTTNNSNDTSSYTRRASIDSSASQQYINEHIQILLDTILLPTSMLLPKSVKKEVSHTILPAFKSTANDVTDNIELILTLPADYIANALNTSTSTSNNDEMKKVDSSSSSSKMKNVSSFMNSVNAGYTSVSKSSRNVISKSSLLNESNISNETIKTSNLLLCGSGSSCIERDFLYNTIVDQ